MIRGMLCILVAVLISGTFGWFVSSIVPFPFSLIIIIPVGWGLGWLAGMVANK